MFHYLKYRSRKCEHRPFGAKIKGFFFCLKFYVNQMTMSFSNTLRTVRINAHVSVFLTLWLWPTVAKKILMAEPSLLGDFRRQICFSVSPHVSEKFPIKTRAGRSPKCSGGRERFIGQWFDVTKQWHTTEKWVQKASPVSFQPHGVRRHTHAAMATAVAQFCCRWRHPPSCKCTPPFLCVGHGNLSSAVMGSHLTLKTAVRLSQHSPLKPECSINTWGPNRKWHNGWRRMRHPELLGGPSSGKHKDHSWGIN